MGLKEIWSFIKGRDLYTGRLPSRSAGDLQFNIACESLARRSSGKPLNYIQYRLKPEDTSFRLDEFIKALEELGGRINQSRDFEGKVHYLIAPTWAASVYPVYQIDDDLGSDEFSPVEGYLKGISVRLYYLNEGPARKWETLFETVGLELVSDFRGKEGTPVTFAFPRLDGEIDYKSFSYESIPLQEVETNYIPKVVTLAERLLEDVREASHGLVVISGPVGTGKSYLIRTLATELGNRRAIVCTPPTKFLEDFGLLAKVTSRFRRSLLILEDIGEVVAADAASKMQDARANLLSLTEGFLSLLNDSLVIVSFNYPIDKIDPAVLRPGRCLANIEIRELPHDMASKLVGFKIPSRSYTLAEVYELRRRGESNLPEMERSPLGLLRRREIGKEE